MLTWRAVYKDKKALPQYNADGTENAYKDIDRYRLGRFDLLNEDEKIVYSVYIHTGQRLIFRRRNLITLGRIGLEERSRKIIYIVGWQMTIKTPEKLRNITSINYIHEDGRVELDGSRSNLELVPEEL